MKISEAISLHTKQFDRFAVFVWQECDDLVTQVDGVVVKADNCFQMDSRLDGIAPKPRNLYFVDEPAYHLDA